jgi:hypothetical protein
MVPFLEYPDWLFWFAVFRRIMSVWFMVGSLYIFKEKVFKE